MVFKPAPKFCASPWYISGLTLAADQLAKYAVTARFSPGESLPVFPPLLHLSYVRNTGAAFGLMKGQQALFVVCTILVVGWIVWEFLRKRPLPAAVAWSYALILGGSVGNLIDRLRVGYVIDFIDLRVWPVFNIGDSAITIGVTLLIWHALFVHRKDQKSDVRGQKSDSGF